MFDEVWNNDKQIQSKFIYFAEIKTEAICSNKSFSILWEFLLNQMLHIFFWTSTRIRLLILTEISLYTDGAGIFQELWS